MPTKRRYYHSIGLLLIGLFINSCSHLFYQPDHWKYSDPQDFNKIYTEGFRTMADGTLIHFWYIKSNRPSSLSPKGLVVLFHGNGMNLTNHLPNLIWMTEEGYDLLLWDYRGYGRSQGESEHHLNILDSQQMLEWAQELKTQHSYPKLIVYGQSLGGQLLGRAMCELSDNKKIDLLVIDSSFTSYQGIAQDRLSTHWITYPFSWLANLLLSDKWAVMNASQFPETPTLFIHSKQDEVIPFEFGQEYFRFWRGKQKYFWALESGKHIETFHGPNEYLRKKLLEFISLTSVRGNF